LNHVKMVLETGKTLARYVDKGKCILVHCSDGWDRTSQIVALTELLLDPYYRTLKGFGILIQKEWIAFGHKFEDRLGHGEPEDYSSEQSPIFIQFMDAVYQLIRQYPNWFEFNEEYLINILDHLFSGRFGTFLMDSESERERENLSAQTVSIWPWLASPERASVFKNPEYYVYNVPIYPNCATSHLHVWTGYYERYKVSMKQYHEHHQQSLNRNKSRTKLRTENQKLKEQIDEDAIKIARYEDILKEKISKETAFQDVLKEEIEKTKDPTHEGYDLEFIVTPNINGKIHFRVKRKSGLYPPQVKKFGVSNLQERMLEDYDPQNKEYNPKRRRSSTDEFVESFLSQAVTLPTDDENPTHFSNNSIITRSGFLDRCAQQAHAFMPLHIPVVTVSLGKVADWLKSVR